MAGAFVALVTTTATTAHAQDPIPTYARGCVVFEDDSYVCGTYFIPQPYDADEPFTIDRTRAYVTGCIPGGLCDTAK